MGIVLKEMTIEKYHQLISEGCLTAKEMVQYYLDRIQRFDQMGPKINAIISVNPEAIQDAEMLDQRFEKEGFVGPLHGVPLLVKDNVETADMVTTAGSLSMADYRAQNDAYVLEKLKAAGAIVIAKTNLHEFAIWGETISSILGQTLNPYDATRTPGGSSGGTGAALAADFGMIGIGTDTINSVRSPASANCVVGIRPTLGLVSRSGIVPYSYTQDTAGPMARCIADAVRMLDVMKGFDPNDESTAWSWIHLKTSLTNHLKSWRLEGVKIGILESLFGKEEVHEETNQAVWQAIEVLRECGAQTVLIKQNFDTDDLVKNVSVHLHDFKDHLNRYFNLSGDALPVNDFNKLYESGLYHPGIKENLEMAMNLTTDSDAYRLRLKKRETLQNELMKMMAIEGVDALIYPHQRQLVCKVGDAQNERNGVIASVTGFPSICVPAGFSKPSETAPIGIPIGMEIFGRPFAEAVLIQIAYAHEKMAKIRKSPMGFYDEKGE